MRQTATTNTAAVDHCIRLAKENIVNMIYTQSEVEYVGLTKEQIDSYLKHGDSGALNEIQSGFLKSLQLCLQIVFDSAKICEPDPLNIIEGYYQTVIKYCRDNRNLLTLDNGMRRDLAAIGCMDSYVQMAAVIYCYILTHKVCERGLSMLAFIAANAILISSGSGIMYANEKDTTKLRKLVDKVKRNGNPTELVEFLIKKCIIKVSVREVG